MLYLGIDQHARQITISLRDEKGRLASARKPVATRPTDPQRKGRCAGELNNVFSRAQSDDRDRIARLRNALVGRGDRPTFDIRKLRRTMIKCNSQQ